MHGPLVSQRRLGRAALSEQGFHGDAQGGFHAQEDREAAQKKGADVVAKLKELKLAKMQAHSRLQQSLGRSGQKQRLRRFLQRGVVRNFRQPEDFDQRGAVNPLRPEAAIIGPQEVFQRQASKQVMLCEFFGFEGDFAT